VTPGEEEVARRRVRGQLGGVNGEGRKIEGGGREGKEGKSSPSSPNGVNSCSLGNIDDKVDVGVVVVVGSSWDFDESISHSNVVGVDFPEDHEIKNEEETWSASFFLSRVS